MRGRRGIIGRMSRGLRGWRGEDEAEVESGGLAGRFRKGTPMQNCKADAAQGKTDCSLQELSIAIQKSGYAGAPSIAATTVQWNLSPRPARTATTLRYHTSTTAQEAKRKAPKSFQLIGSPGIEAGSYRGRDCRRGNMLPLPPTRFVSCAAIHVQRNCANI